MADNLHIYGFRPYKPRSGQGFVAPIALTVATGQDDVDDAAQSVHIRPGDPLKLLSTGGVSVALTTEEVAYICAGILPYWSASDGTMVFGKHYPNQTAWGTIEARRGYVLGWRVDAYTWEIDCDDAVTATTKAAYVALINENCPFVVPGNTATGYADPFADISLHDPADVDDSLRIVGISDSIHNRDFSGNYVKILVDWNMSDVAGWPAAGSLVAGV